MFIQLPRDQIATVGAGPQPLVLMVPRVGYLTLISELVREHFAQHVPALDGRLWFEDRGSPVRWHYPAGVLYDAANIKGPWHLTAHFLSFPESEILVCQDEASAKMVFFQAVKEAMFMKQGNVLPLMNLAIEDQDRLCKSLVGLGTSRNHGDGPHMLQSSLDSFTEVDGKLNGSDIQSIAAVPIRAHRTDVDSVPGGTQLLGGKNLAEGALEDLLAQLRPPPQPGCRVIIQGVEVDNSVSVAWLYTHFRMPDGFLHLVVRSQ